MTIPELLELLKTGGSGVSLLLVGALLWMNRERERLLKALTDKDQELQQERQQSRSDAMLFARAAERMRGISSGPKQT